MRLIHTLALALAIAIGSLSVNAQIEKAKKSYNFTRGLEEFQNGNKEEAIDFLNKEIAENPNNGYAHFYIAGIEVEKENYAEAMSSLNTALGKLPKKDKEYVARALAARAGLYTTIGDTIQALADYDKALKTNPKDTDILEDHAQLLYELDRYSDADADYRKIMELNPASVMGYMGLGRDAYAMGNYQEAIKLYDKVIAMYDNYSNGYSFRAESYLKEGRYVEAADDVMKALEIDNDTKAYWLLFDFPKDKLPLVTTKLKAMAVKNPHNAEWHYYAGNLYHVNKMHREAIDALKKAFDIDAYYSFLECIADSYAKLGEYASAIDAITQAQQMVPDKLDLIGEKADMLGDWGKLDEAVAEWSRYIDKAPDDYGGYYRRAFFEENSGRHDEALADYDMAIMLNPGYAYAYLGKGDILKHKGQEADATEAYRKVVELDTVPNNTSCAMYALLELGKKDDAIDFMNRVIEQDSLDTGNYYDGACLYARIGDLDKSLAYLKKALELGFKRIHQIYADDDLEALRGTDAFKSLMDEYKPIEVPCEEIETVCDSTVFVDEPLSRIEIPFTPDSGCAVVKCSINELPLSFIFDTGASSVSLSMVEANFMLKNGYLKKDDFVGSQHFVDANGDISEGTVVNLRNVDFGGLTLNNVRASIVRNQKAPLLLGQSVLGRLGSIEIDNPGKKLIITHNTK